jgi:hypothetical protein
MYIICVPAMLLLCTVYKMSYSEMFINNKNVSVTPTPLLPLGITDSKQSSHEWHNYHIKSHVNSSACSNVITKRHTHTYKGKSPQYISQSLYLLQTFQHVRNSYLL